MSADWQAFPLSDVYEFRSGLSKPRSAFGTGYAFLTFKDVFYNTFVPDCLGDLVDSSARERALCSVRRGDVFLTRTSETQHELGMSCVALRDYDSATFNGFCKRLRPKREGEICPEYAAYYFRGPAFRRTVTAMSSMSTRASLNEEMLGRLKIVLPSLDIQRAIAFQLKALDDKIELNRRMNETLEWMARALFKSWFVDFDPVHAKAAGKRPYGMDDATAALFPDSFDESGADQAPKSWSATTLGSLTLYLQRGFQPAYTTSDDGILVVNQKCVRNGRVDFSLARRHDTQKRAVEGRTLRELDVLVNSTGVGTLGRVAILAKSSPDATCDSHVTVLRSDTSKADAYWFGCQLRFLQPLIETLGQGSTGQTELSRARLAALEVSTPGRALQDRFSRIVAPILERMWKAEAESVTLASIRDTLLPRLLSGELRVDKAEKAVAEAV